MRIDGRSVLLTGASGGLGEAIARALAGRGAQLLLSGRRLDVLRPLAAELGARTVAADLSDRADVDRLIEAMEGEDLDVLVANAGLPASGLLADYTMEQIDRALDVNLRAPILLARALSRGMAERGQGHLVFMSSASGKVATHRTSIYSATKFGLRGFAQGLREDLRESHVGVSTIFPGPIAEAGMFADAGDIRLPAGTRPKTPADVGRAVVRAIEHNRAEIDVAPAAMRWGTTLGSAAPGLVAALNRRLGSERIAERVARSDAHVSKR